MKKENLKNFKETYTEFINDCDPVANILSNVKEYQKPSFNCNPAFADTFTIVGDDIFWVGEENWRYGERHYGNFPLEYLTMTDEELQKIVDKMNEEYDKKQETLKKEKEEREKAKRLADYEKLKKEFS